MDIDQALNVEELRGRCLEHSRRAYRLLPALEQSRILDIGCGQGQQGKARLKFSLGGKPVRFETIGVVAGRDEKVELVPSVRYVGITEESVMVLQLLFDGQKRVGS